MKSFAPERPKVDFEVVVEGEMVLGLPSELEMVESRRSVVESRIEGGVEAPFASKRESVDGSKRKIYT